MRRAIEDDGAELIVVNPSGSICADYADIWLQPTARHGRRAVQRPGAKSSSTKGWRTRSSSRERTEGFDGVATQPWSEYTPECVAGITGVPAEDLRRGGATLCAAAARGSCLIWGMGMTQHTNGTANAHSLLNLALVAGQMGLPGSTASRRCAARTTCRAAATRAAFPTSLPGYQRYRPDAIAAKFEAAWGADLPTDEG